MIENKSKISYLIYASGGGAVKLRFLTVILFWFLSGASEAQQSLPVQDYNVVPKTWFNPVPQGSSYGSPYAACEANFQYFAVNAGRQIGQFIMNADGDSITCPSTNGGGTDGIGELRCKGDSIHLPGTSSCLQPIFTSQCQATAPAATQAPQPIDIATGAKMEVAVDFSTADGLLYHKRSYNSQAPMMSQHGKMWTHNHDRQMVYSPFSYPAHIMLIQLGDQRLLIFGGTINGDGDRIWSPAKPSGSGFTTPSANRTGFELVETATGTYELTYPNGQTDFYDSNYQLTRIEYQGGYYKDLTYTNGKLTDVTDAYGRQITYDYSGEVLDSVTAPDGREFTYSYHENQIYGQDGVGNVIYAEFEFVLDEVESPEGDTTTYLHAIPGDPETGSEFNVDARVTGIVDARGVTTKTIVYDENRALASAGPDGANYWEVESLPYGQYDYYRYLTVTNPLGHVRNDTFFRATGRPSKTENSAAVGVQQAATRYYWSADQVSKVRDANGVDTFYTYNARGLPTQIIYKRYTSASTTVNISWHADWNVPILVSLPGRTTSYTYDTEGRRLSETVTDTATSETRTTTYGWSMSGQLLTIDGPLAGTGDQTVMTYSSTGNLTSVTEPGGYATVITAHNGLGYPTQYTDPNGRQISLTYEKGDRLTGMTISAGGQTRTMSFTYDDVGNVTSVTLPTGGMHTYSYDGNSRVTEVLSSDGESLAFTYDPMGNVTSRTISSGASARFISSAEYDTLGRLVRLLDHASNPMSFGYDKLDQLVSSMDAANATRTMGRDALGRVTETTDPLNATVSTPRDDLGNIESVTDGGGVTTNFTYNAFGEVVQEVSPDRGTISYEYDAAGRETRMVSGSGSDVSYTYDVSDRPLTRTSSGGQAVTFAYGSNSGDKGLLVSMTDEAGVTGFSYDAFGDLAQEVRTLGSQSYTTSYTRDANGDVIHIAYPSGREVQINRNALGKVTSMNTRVSSASAYETVASGLVWEPYGPLVGYTSSNGLSNDRVVNQSYQLTGLEVGTGSALLLDKQISRDSLQRVSLITDGLDSARTADFTYDLNGRLTDANGVWGDLSWTYDSTGNRLDEAFVDPLSNASGEDYLYSSGTNRLASVTDGGATTLRAFEYTGDGHISRDTRTGGDDFHYIYDEFQRLVEVRDSGLQLVASYEYDGFDRRVSRDVTGGSSVHYIFDEMDRPIAEHDASTGAVLREYIWLGDLLIGMVEAGNLYAVHGGHLGQPLMMTDDLQAVVWDTEYTPFGAALPQVFVEDIELRFPGQWAQAETALIQNWHRDYDPSLGRYIQADPLGLAAGQSIYGYALGDPVNFTDPTGEIVPFLLSAGIGAVLGAGLEYFTNPCASAADLLFAASTGALGGGLSKLHYLRHAPRALSRVIGKEWSHTIPKRIVDRYTSGWLRRILNRRGGLNGSWVTPRRHFKHDFYRYPRGSGDWGKRYPIVLRQIDRIPDWFKGSVASGVGASMAAGNNNRCDCR